MGFEIQRYLHIATWKATNEKNEIFVVESSGTLHSIAEDCLKIEDKSISSNRSPSYRMICHCSDKDGDGEKDLLGKKK